MVTAPTTPRHHRHRGRPACKPWIHKLDHMAVAGRRLSGNLLCHPLHLRGLLGQSTKSFTGGTRAFEKHSQTPSPSHGVQRTKPLRFNGSGRTNRHASMQMQVLDAIVSQQSSSARAGLAHCCVDASTVLCHCWSHNVRLFSKSRGFWRPTHCIYVARIVAHSYFHCNWTGRHCTAHASARQPRRIHVVLDKSKIVHSLLLQIDRHTTVT